MEELKPWEKVVSAIIWGIILSILLVGVAGGWLYIVDMWTGG
jgi:hypothetical protein